MSDKNNDGFDPQIFGNTSRREVLKHSSVMSGLAALGLLPAISAQGMEPEILSEYSSATDKELLQAFDDILDGLRRTARTAFKRSTATTPQERVAGLRHILDNFSLLLAVKVHDADPMNPEITRMLGPHRKFGGDNPDGLYYTATLISTESYRIYGSRGSAKVVSFVLKYGGPVWGTRSANKLLGQDLKVDGSGNFELFLGGEPRDENWLPLNSGVDRIVIRQFFADWENEEPMALMIERIGPPAPPTDLSAERVLGGLNTAIKLLENDGVFWQNQMDAFRPTPNRFLFYRAAVGIKIGTPGGEPLAGFWDIPPDSALIIRVKPPECYFWNIEFNNSWWETQDYRYRLSGTNIHYAAIEESGEMIAVASHDDPGVPNWLDTGGFTQGMMVQRWMGAEVSPIPTCSLVKRSDLYKYLPADVKTISTAQRAEQIAARRRGIYKRFGSM